MYSIEMLYYIKCNDVTFKISFFSSDSRSFHKMWKQSESERTVVQ